MEPQQVQPQIVVNMPSAPAAEPPSVLDAAADPTVRYIVEQARLAIDAGADATPDLVAKIEASVEGYGEGCLVIAGVFGASALVPVVLLAILWKHVGMKTADDDDAAFTLFGGSLVLGVAFVVFTANAFGWLTEGAVAYHAPLVWLAQNLGK